MIDDLLKDSLLKDLAEIIDSGKKDIAVSINSTITKVYWQIGNRINIEILKETRAEYGKQIIKKVSKFLMTHFGSGWGEKHIRHCLRIAETFQSEEIVSTLWRQLSWSHLKEVTSFKCELKCKFYIEIAQNQIRTSL
jgi:hypothetical protein